MLLYIVYLILFIVIVLMQLSIHKSHELKEISDIIKNEPAYTNTSSSNYYNKTGIFVPPTEFNFNDITTTSMIIDWFDIIFSNYVFIKTGVIANQNYVFGTPRARLSLRLYKVNNNTNTDTNQAITYVIPNIKVDFYDDLNEKHENKVSIKLRNGDTLYHTSPGTFKSPLEKGGYVVEFTRNDSNLADSVAELYTDDNIVSGWAFIILEFVYYNRNLDAIVKNDVVFSRSPAGAVDKKYEVTVIWNYYKAPIDYFRACLEIIFVLLYI